MRLSRWKSTGPGDAVILCGLAGGLTTDLHPGDVVIPDEMSFEGGPVRSLDASLVSVLRTAAGSLGFEACGGRLVTASHLVSGDERAIWAGRGFIAADMEAALLPEKSRFAVIRVILDVPDHSISAQWARPARVHPNRQRVGEMVWMARYAPVFARRAARIASASARQLIQSEST